VRVLASRWLLPWIGFAVVLSVAASVTQDFLASNGLDWTRSATEVADSLTRQASKVGVSDIVSYIKYAKLLIEQLGGPVSSAPTDPAFTDAWVVRSWPPGFPAIVAGVLAITGEAAYLAKLLAVAIALWATALVSFLNLVPFHPRRWVRFVCLGALWLLPGLRRSSLGVGAFIADSTATALFVLSLALIADGLLRRRRRSFHFAGATLALAVNCRTALDLQVQFVTIGLLGGALGWWVLAVLPRLWEGGASWGAVRDALRSPDALPHRRALAGLAVFFLIVSAGTAPWKLFNYLHHGVYGFSTTGSATEWDYQWLLPESLPWFVHAGNTACVLDIDFCRFVNRNRSVLAPYHKELAIAAFVRNPWGWISHRLSNLNWLWVGLPWTPPPGAGLDWWASYLEGSLYVASLLVGLWLLARGLTRAARAEDRRMLVLQAAIVLLCLGANAAMFAVVHYEERYSLPLRLLCLWTTATVVASSSLRNGT